MLQVKHLEEEFNVSTKVMEKGRGRSKHFRLKQPRSQKPTFIANQCNGCSQCKKMEKSQQNNFQTYKEIKTASNCERKERTFLFAKEMRMPLALCHALSCIFFHDVVRVGHTGFFLRAAQLFPDRVSGGVTQVSFQVVVNNFLSSKLQHSVSMTSDGGHTGFFLRIA